MRAENWNVEVAEFVVDALLRAKLLKPENVESAIDVTAEELLVVSLFGDYSLGASNEKLK